MLSRTYQSPLLALPVLPTVWAAAPHRSSSLSNIPRAACNSSSSSGGPRLKTLERVLGVNLEVADDEDDAIRRLAADGTGAYWSSADAEW